MKEMDSGSEKGIAPSKRINSSPKRSSSGSAENDENYQTTPMFENNKKVVSKHFMLPTISAASEATSPRKKILGEKNDNSVSSDAQQYKTVNLEVEKCPQNSVISKSDQASSVIVTSYNYVPEANEKGDSHFPDDCLGKMYDPFTNYLSPRPQYLRFNPNRRFEILNRLENEGIDLNDLVGFEEVSDEELTLVDEVQHSCLPSPNSHSGRPKIDENNKQVDEKYDEEDKEEEEEEVEVEGRSCLGGLLKHMVMFVGFVLFMSYIGPMNSPAPLPTKLAVYSNLTDGYLLVKEQTLDFMSTMMDDAGFLTEEVKDYDGGGVCGDSEEMIDVNEGIFLEGLGDGNVQYEVEDESEEVIEVNEEILEEGVGDENVRNDIEEEEEEDSEDKIDVGDETEEGLRYDAFEFEDDNFQQIMGLVKERESEIVGDDEVVSESKDTAVAGHGLESEGSESSQQLNEDVSGDGLESESSESSQQLADEKLIKSDDKFGEIGFQNKVEMQKLRWSILSVVGVFLGSILLAALTFFYTSKKARNAIKISKAAAKKQPHKKVTEDKKVAATAIAPPAEKKVEFLAKPSLPQLAGEAAAELNYRIHAPIVELIGEIDVGERKNLRRDVSAYKSQANEFKENNAIHFPTFSSSQLVSTPIQKSPAFDYSSTNSSLCGSFATETKRLKNEGGGHSGEATNKATTPLRRSSRIRRSIVANSP